MIELIKYRKSVNIYVEDVQIDELIKNFHQQYLNKLSINASNAK
jgi:hypothetical protein